MKDNKNNTGIVLERFRQINSYNFSKSLLNEQEPPLPEEDPLNAPAADPNAAVPPGDDMGIAPEEDPMAGETDSVDDTTPGDPLEAEPTDEDDTTEEIDITDLVNMVKDVKKNMESQKDQDPSKTGKMDDVFAKLSELEGKLGEMDQVLAKIDELGGKIQSMKPPTPVEKLEMRSIDSYPFNQKPDEFFKEKQEDMRRSGKNEYVLTKQDVENYGKYDMMKSFNPTSDNSLV